MSATFTICEGAVKRKGRTKTLVCTSFFMELFLWDPHWIHKIHRWIL